jgi:glycosyltransferase involved in cell wall biosynthesis
VTVAALTMVVPTYNEAGRVDVEAMLGFLALDPSHRLLFVDDGSRDTTPELLEALRSRAPDRIAVHCFPANRGKAEAVRQGLLMAMDAGAPIAGFIDADLSAPFSEVAALLADLRARPEVWAVFGSRIKLLGRRVIRSELRHYIGRIFATAASVTLGLAVYDTQCGLKLFRDTPEVRAALKAPFVSRWIFDVELLGRLSDAAGAAIGSRVREVPLERWEERGASRLRLRDFLRAPMELWRIRWRKRSG